MVFSSRLGWLADVAKNAQGRGWLARGLLASGCVSRILIDQGFVEFLLSLKISLNDGSV